MANKIISSFKKLGGAVRKNSPLLLTVGTVVGVGGVIFTTIKATRKYDSEVEPDMTKKEKAKIAAKSYWPVALTGGATVACAVGAQKINSNRIATATAAYEFTKEAFDTYREKVKEKIGVNGEREARAELAGERLAKEHPDIYADPSLIPGSGVIFIEEWSGQVFRSSIDDICLEAKRFNEDLRGSDWLCLNEWLCHLGLNPMGYRIGENLGFGERYDHDGLNLRFTPSDKIFATGETATLISYDDDLIAYQDYTCLNC